MSSELPLLRLVPLLAAIPRAALGRWPTPVEVAPGVDSTIWLKRDDLSADPLGGNKVRALEFLLGGIGPGEDIVTVGALGSTHALATALYGRRLGARVTILRWPQEPSGPAAAVCRWAEREAAVARTTRTVAGAYLGALPERLRGSRWIPAGGSTALGVLGHVNAALELADQVRRGELPAPARIVVPLGSGGTAAGLALGIALAGMDTEIVAVRVVPRIVARRRHVLRLARGAARILGQHGVRALPRVGRVRIVHTEYGGAYGRATVRTREAIERFRATVGLALEPTYSGKAFAAALTEACRGDGPTLFWLTFDGRWLPLPSTEDRER